MKVDNGLICYVQRDGLHVIGDSSIQTVGFDEAAMKRALDVAWSAGGKPEYIILTDGTVSKRTVKHWRGKRFCIAPVFTGRWW